MRNRVVWPWPKMSKRIVSKGGFPLTENFPRTGTERNRKAHGHARGSREQENFPLRSVPRKVESSSTFSVLSVRKRYRMI